MEYMILSTAYLGVFWLGYHFLLHKETYFRINRLAILSSVVIAMVLPVIPEFIHVSDHSIFTYTILENTISVPSYLDISDEKSAYQFSWWDAVRVVYFLGVLVFANRFLKGLWVIRHLDAKCESVRKGDKIIMVHTENMAPFSFLNRIYLPKHILQNKDLDIILEHESVHVDQWHSMDILIIELLRIPFWWNPLLVLFKRDLSEVHEYLADSVAYTHFDPAGYRRLLYKHIIKNNLDFTHPFYNHNIKKRIIMLSKSETNQNRLWKYYFMLAIALVVCILQCTDAADQQPDKQLQEEVSDKFNSVTAEPSQSTVNEIQAENKIYKIADEMPRFPGCETEDMAEEERTKCSTQKLLEFVYSNMTYPEAAREQGIEGMSVVQFVINEKGRISDISIAKSVSPEIDEVVRNLVEKMNELDPWRPGITDGNPVNVQYTLPVKFKLEQ